MPALKPYYHFLTEPHFNPLSLRNNTWNSMRISYNWLNDYLPFKHDPERIGRVLTSMGLEVESLEAYENIKGGLKGLVIGEVLTCEKHPHADKLKLTTVNIGGESPLNIVCGAPNVAVGQKVIVAPVGTTIYPINGEPVTMKKAKIRGIESEGMICAEDEIGIGESHDGIVVLPADAVPGTPALGYYKPYHDYVYELGLTPNRMDAMSHLGVARDLCAYFTHHEKTEFRVKSPLNNNALKSKSNDLPITVEIVNKDACKRYSGVAIKNITIKESPEWLQNKLKAIGQRPINNIVDITNFILHETGLPLHAFDYDKIGGKGIKVMNLPEGTPFITLDGKERKLSSEDLMICDANSKPLCIAGVFGGRDSGVNESTVNIFLECAWFNPVAVRKTSFRHDLRTDAAARFEKNTDISATVNVLKRAAALILDIAGGEIASEFIDEYPDPQEKKLVSIQFHYLKKLSGKTYHFDTVKKILQSLGFEISKEGIDDLSVLVPFHKPDISHPADIVEEIMRIDGLDNIPIPQSITISPSVETHAREIQLKEKTANFLAGAGFNEILVNSITNSAYFDDATLEHSIKLLNNLSAVHNVLRPSMLETGLEVVAYNLNRKNHHLRLFEFGKTYHKTEEGKYSEPEHLSLFLTGNVREGNWQRAEIGSDIYYLKGVAEQLMKLWNLKNVEWVPFQLSGFSSALQLVINRVQAGFIGIVAKDTLKKFDIKQSVYFADFYWNEIMKLTEKQTIRFKELPRQLPVYRDLAIVVDKKLEYGKVEDAIKKARVQKLKGIHLFDVFESEKLGADKKSMAISFTFLDEEKTLTDQEIDSMMQKLINTLQKEAGAEIRN